MKLTKSQLKEMIREELLTEKPLKTNPKIWVSDKFDKVIDKLPFAKLTKANVIKLAKKFKIDKDDALRWVSYNQDVDFGLKEGKLNENYNKVWNNWVSALDNFEKATGNLAKYNSKVTADKVDERIILQNFKKYINPFYNLMKSWKKGKK